MRYVIVPSLQWIYVCVIHLIKCKSSISKSRSDKSHINMINFLSSCNLVCRMPWLYGQKSSICFCKQSFVFLSSFKSVKVQLLGPFRCQNQHWLPQNYVLCTLKRTLRANQTSHTTYLILIRSCTIIYLIWQHASLGTP